MSRLMKVLAVVGAALLVVSCGPSGPAKKVCYPVSGELTVGGKPADGATVMFQPRDANPTDWSAGYPRATVGADGKFQVSTYGENDGAPEGEYIVLVTWPAPNPGNEEGSGPDRLGGKYIEPAKSQLKAKIEPKSNQLEPIRLP